MMIWRGIFAALMLSVIVLSTHSGAPVQAAPALDTRVAAR